MGTHRRNCNTGILRARNAPNICHFCGRFSISKNLLWMFGNFWFRKLCGHWNKKVWITVEKLNGSMSSRFVHFPPISTEITTSSIDTLWFYHLIITFIIKWSTTKEIWAVQEHCILPVANGNGWNSSHQPEKLFPSPLSFVRENHAEPLQKLCL